MIRSSRWFPLVLLLAPISGFSATPCEPSAQLLTNPYVPRVGKCIFSLKRTIAKPESRKLAEDLLRRAVTDTEHRNRGPDDPLSFYELAELAALLGTPTATDAMLDFIVGDPGSADESRSSAIARLYELRAPLVLSRMAVRPKRDREELTASIAWGLANNFYLFMTRENYARLAAGANWEVTEPTYPHRELSKAIEDVAWRYRAVKRIRKKPVVLCRRLPNKRFDRSAQERRSWVPVALRAPAPGQPQRYVA